VETEFPVEREDATKPADQEPSVEDTEDAKNPAEFTT
jgi:hypothetical protein